MKYELFFHLPDLTTRSTIEGASSVESSAVCNTPYSWSRLLSKTCFSRTQLLPGLLFPASLAAVLWGRDSSGFTDNTSSCNPPLTEQQSGAFLLDNNILEISRSCCRLYRCLPHHTARARTRTAMVTARMTSVLVSDSSLHCV